MQCCANVKKFPLRCVSLRTGVDVPRDFEKGFEVFGIGEEGDLENAQKEDTLINMLILINSLYLCYV